MNMKKNYIITTVSVIAVAVLGAIFTRFGMQWFEGLTKPSQWIPSFIIPIIWSVIYASFIAALCLWQKRKPLTTENIVLLVINGVMNVLWCLVFFALKSLFLGNVIIVINALFSIKLLFEICKESSVYGLWLSIYPIWLCVATTLNLAVWILN